MRKVRIKSLPKAQQGGGMASHGLEKFMPGQQQFKQSDNHFSEPDFEVNNSISAVPREESNIEAEGGETAVVPGMGGIPESFKIQGPRHGANGVPLNLAQDSFIFSDNKKGMKINDKEILKEFGVSVPKGKKKAKGMTPAALSKKFPLNDYKKILMDPNSDKLERETAELMIQNYNLKLGKLALVQESMKGFPQGIPAIAQPFLQTIGADPSMIAPQITQPKMQNGGSVSGAIGEQGAFWDSIMQNGGDVNKYQGGGPTTIFDLQEETQPLGNLTTLEDAPSGEETVAEEALKPTTEYNIPDSYKNDPKYDESSPEYDKTLIKPGGYTKRADGKWYKVIQKPLDLPDYAGEDKQQTFGEANDVAKKYAFLEKTFNDPEIKAVFAEKTRAALKNPDYYARKKGASGSKKGFISDAQIDAMTDDEIVNHHLNMQKRNYAFGANGIDPKHFSDRNGTVRPEFRKKYAAMNISNLNDAAERVGVPLGIQGSDTDIGIEQGTYWGYRDMIKDRENLTPEVQTKLKPFKSPGQWGEGDEGQTGADKISPIDQWYTDTSAGELDPIDLQELDFQEASLIEDDPDVIKPNDIAFEEPDQTAPWWIQDRMNVSNLIGQRLSAKKYLPHEAPVDFARPDVLYYDPSRALASNIEQQQIGNEFLRGTANSAQQAHAAGKFSGDAFKRGMDVIGQYENMNVGIGNQYLDKVKATQDQQSIANAQSMKRLFDEWTVANQQFDNTKRIMNRNLTEGLIQGQTNAMMAQAFNTQSEQFQTDPNIGGGMWWTGKGRDFVDTGRAPGGSSGDAYIKQFSALKGQNPGVPDNIIKQQLDQSSGLPATNPRMEQQKQMMQMYSGAFNPGMFKG